MKMILDVDTRAIGRSGQFWCRDNHLANFIVIENFVDSTIAQGVLWSVEGFPDVQSNQTQAFTRRSLQNDKFDRRRAG